MAGQGPIPSRAPTTRRVSIRSAVITLDGPEQAYPVYRFSGRQIFERPTHQPFFQDDVLVIANPGFVPFGQVSLIYAGLHFTATPQTGPNPNTPFVFSILDVADGGAGILPPGLTISDDGLIGGTPTLDGTFPFTVFVTDQAEFATGQRNASITVVP